MNAGKPVFTVAEMAQGDDPALNVVKTLTVEYTVNGKPESTSGKDPETICLANKAIDDAAAPGRADRRGRRRRVVGGMAERPLRAHHGLRPQVVRHGRGSSARPDRVGPWQVKFPAGSGAPEQLSLEKLVAWNLRPEDAVKYFSGTATYLKTVTIPAELLGKDRGLYLDLGRVAVMAQVKLNGHDLGVLWKAPYRVEISRFAKPGENTLEIEVTNLWINRMIGDENLPEDSDRNGNGTLKAWPKWLMEGKSSPTGRQIVQFLEAL